MNYNFIYASDGGLLILLAIAFYIGFYFGKRKSITPLTDDECEAIINRHDWFSKSWRDMAKEIHDAILKKASEK